MSELIRIHGCGKIGCVGKLTFFWQAVLLTFFSAPTFLKSEHRTPIQVSPLEIGSYFPILKGKMTHIQADATTFIIQSTPPKKPPDQTNGTPPTFFGY